MQIFYPGKDFTIVFHGLKGIFFRGRSRRVVCLQLEIQHCTLQERGLERLYREYKTQYLLPQETSSTGPLTAGIPTLC